MKIYLIVILFYLLPLVFNWLWCHFEFKNDNSDSPSLFDLCAVFIPV
jgi:hypothetical protein